MTTYDVGPRPRPRRYSAPGSLSLIMQPTKRPDGASGEGLRVCYEHAEPYPYGATPAWVTDERGREVCDACAARAIARGEAVLGDVADEPTAQHLARPLCSAQVHADAAAVTVVTRALRTAAGGGPETQALRAALAALRSEASGE